MLREGFSAEVTDFLHKDNLPGPENIPGQGAFFYKNGGYFVEKV